MYFLALQNTYQALELALFYDQNCKEKVSIDKLVASRLLITTLQSLLNRHGITCSDLAFIVANQGPGPFTTLRIVMTTANGIGFALNTPLVGVDGLAAFAQEYSNQDFPITIALLNAFNRDVYYAINGNNQPLKTGCQNIDVFLAELNQLFPETTVRFIGNATEIYYKEIMSVFGSRTHIPTPLPQTCSLEYVAHVGLAQWHAKQHIYKQLEPLYIKQFSAIMKTQVRTNL